MTRDLNLIRKIAIILDHSESLIESANITIEGFTPDQIGYNCDMMREYGLILADELGSHNMIYSELRIRRLTWSGHDFLDAARDDTIWNKTTTRIKDKATSAAFDVVLEFLKSAGRSVIGQVSEWASQ